MRSVGMEGSLGEVSGVWVRVWERERERERYIYIFIHIHVHIHTHTCIQRRLKGDGKGFL